jgi:hypothetical protein
LNLAFLTAFASSRQLKRVADEGKLLLRQAHRQNRGANSSKRNPKASVITNRMRLCSLDQNHVPGIRSAVIIALLVALAAPVERGEGWLHISEALAIRVIQIIHQMQTLYLSEYGDSSKLERGTG